MTWLTAVRLWGEYSWSISPQPVKSLWSHFYTEIFMLSIFVPYEFVFNFVLFPPLSLSLLLLEKHHVSFFFPSFIYSLLFKCCRKLNLISFCVFPFLMLWTLFLIKFFFCFIWHQEYICVNLFYIYFNRWILSFQLPFWYFC